MYKWDEFKNITAITTTREGGFSSGHFASANLALHVKDDEVAVRKNRAKVFALKDINMTKENSVFVHQYHSDVTLKVTKKDVGKGYDSFSDGLKADALYTKEKGINLAVYHADCVPVFIVVPAHDIVGIIHAGEEGSVANITGKFVQTLVKNEGVKPNEIYAHIGPALSFSYRKISEEHAKTLAKCRGIVQKAVKAVVPEYYIDLPLLNILALREEGIPLDNISLSNECTYENNDRYFSYAKEKMTGRNISLIRRN